jgi:pimeloyl-ACP methyl ester carboxylesterase
MKRGLFFWLKRILMGIALLIVACVLLGLISIEVMEGLQSSSTRIETENGIESKELVELGGVSQSIYLRGQDRNKPVLLFLHGGPGAPSTPMVREFGLRIEESFVVVHWDQRGSGNSCSSEIPDDSLQLEQYLADTLQLVNLLRSRFDTEKIFLVGHSWGSVLGVMIAQRHPELFHAYVGMGQVVDMVRNEEISYRFVVDRAKQEGNAKAIRELETIRPPYANREDLMLQRSWLGHYHGDFLAGDALEKFALAILFSPEYSFQKKFSFYSCMLNSLDRAWSDLDHINFIETARRLDLPVFFFAGRHDYNTPFELVQEYFDVLEAPRKEFFWFENSAHSPNLEEPERYQEILIDQILPIALARD